MVGDKVNLQEVYKKMAEDINYLFTRKADALKYDKTFRGKVIRQESTSKYKVLHKNKEYPVKSDYKLSVGDLVWICAPCNNWDELYVKSSNGVGKTISSLENYEFRADGIYLEGVKITK